LNREKLLSIFCLGFLVIVNDGLAIEFGQIELVSISRINSWTLVSDVFLSDPKVWLHDPALSDDDRPTVTCIADGTAHPMPWTNVWDAFTFPLSDNIEPPESATPQDPSYFNDKAFSWTAVDESTDLTATGTVSGIRDVPLSSNLTITGDPLQPTISWSNPDENLDAYRVRLYEKAGDGSLVLLKQSDDIQGTTYTVPDEARLEYGKNYIIRVEARDYEYFGLSGDLPYTDFQGKVLNRSNAEADIPFTPSDGAAEGNTLEMTTGSPIGASLTVDTPSIAFNVEFDYRFTTTDGYLDVYLNGIQIGTRLTAPDTVNDEFLHAILQVDNTSLYNLNAVALLFQLNGPTGISILLDNVAYSFFDDSQMQFLLQQNGGFNAGLESWTASGGGTLSIQSTQSRGPWRWWYSG